MSDYKFVKFTNHGSKLGNYKISINRSDTLGLLSGFYVKENISKFKKAVLFFDKAKKSIAISFTNDSNADGAFTVSHGQRNTGSITAHSFFIGNEIKEPRFFGQKVPKKIKDDQLGTLYVIDLLGS